nr:MFS transporter [Chitinophagaceae bacterium]
MDTAGAVLGPLTAMLFLYFFPGHYKTIFLISIIPGVLSILSTCWINEKKMSASPLKPSISLSRNLNYYRQASTQFQQLIVPLFFFSLLNSSDMFLLLQSSQLSLGPDKVIFMYLLFNVVYMLFAFPMGKLADAHGKVTIFLLGIFFFVITYVGFAFTHNLLFVVGLFVGYGLFYACTQGAIKSILLKFTPAHEKSSAIGFYEGGNSIGLLIANSMAGLIWFQWGAKILFIYTAIGACLFIGWFLVAYLRAAKN